MTEAEWLACNDLSELLAYMTGRSSSRKFRLLGCACCRRIWHLLNDPCRNAVLTAELWADEPVKDAEIDAARFAVNTCCTEVTLTPSDPKYSWAYSSARLVLFDAPFWNPNAAEQWVSGAARSVAEASWRHDGVDGPAGEIRHQLQLFRDVFENPYRPVWLDPEVLTSTVVALAAGIYAERAFDRMPILADALEEAGCDHADILAHCRGDGPHVRGCWVVDLLLGKE